MKAYVCVAVFVVIFGVLEGLPAQFKHRENALHHIRKLAKSKPFLKRGNVQQVFRDKVHSKQPFLKRDTECEQVYESLQELIDVMREFNTVSEIKETFQPMIGGDFDVLDPNGLHDFSCAVASYTIEDVMQQFGVATEEEARVLWQGVKEVYVDINQTMQGLIEMLDEMAEETGEPLQEAPEYRYAASFQEFIQTLMDIGYFDL